MPATVPERRNTTGTDPLYITIERFNRARLRTRLIAHRF